MLTLLEAAKLVQDPLARGVIEIFPRTSPVLERLPFFNVNGQAYKYNQEKTLPGIAFRGINQSYTESTGIVNPMVETLFIVGGISKVDRALVKTQGNVNSLRAIYDGMKAKALAIGYTHKFFKGSNSTDPLEFDGLEARCTGAQVINMGSTSGGDALTLDGLDLLLDAVQGGADVLFMNKTMRRKVNKLIRAANQATEVVSGAFGQQLLSYAGVPIAVIEQDAAGNEILPFTEANPGAGAAASTSIYAVKFGVAENVSGLQAGPMDVIDLGLSGTAYQTLIEWVCGYGRVPPKGCGPAARHQERVDCSRISRVSEGRQKCRHTETMERNVLIVKNTEGVVIPVSPGESVKTFDAITVAGFTQTSEAPTAWVIGRRKATDHIRSDHG